MKQTKSMAATALSLKVLTLGGILASYDGDDDDDDLVDDDEEDLDGFSIEGDDDLDADEEDDHLEGEDSIGGDSE